MRQHTRALASLLLASGYILALSAPSAQQADRPARRVDSDDRALERHTPRSSSPIGAPSIAADDRMSDLELSTAVDRELSRDPLVSMERVEVGAEDGTVTLVGTVSNLLAKERAVHVAESVRGVYRVVNNVVVVPRVRLNPEVLEDALTQALLENPATESYKATVRADAEGEVTLTGRARSWAEKELMGRVVKGVRGVTGVRNALEIIRDEQRLDRDLAAEVREMLRWDAYVSDAVDVRVEDGIVRLSGSVASPAEKRRAIAIANLSDPRKVTAEALEIDASDAQASRGKSRAAATAQARASALNVKLAADPELAANKLQATVDDGVATLRGRVDTLAEKRAAARAALGIEGIDHVNNGLEVATGVLSDQQIVTRAVRALGRSPVTDATRIAVGAKNGVVELNGRVDTWYQRGIADHIIAGIPGVRRIENHLAVTRTEDRFTYEPYADTWSLLEYDWYTPSTPAIRKQDSAIVEDIRDEFFWSPLVDGSDIRIAVEDGVATLTGAAGSTRERRAAAENALEGGAVEVINRLRIGG
jgi:osmotically-inducible protein OsmY